MNPSRPRSSGSGEEILFHKNERRWQQEHLHREEPYYQFINEFNDEDYWLMRDYYLLGTPGEIMSEELQQRLDRAKEHLASQPGLRSGASKGDSENLREHSDEDSLLRWLNTFWRTGNVTRSGQNGNHSWRATHVKSNSRRRRNHQVLSCHTALSSNHTRN
uniref:E3 ubiquitin-protein ligase RNF6/12 N-terminal domain-containing protein n=1 Tax=Peromyscus maniculatus bairdii TaxID=230844 RepID=A0A8C8W8R7_PERMB